MKLNKTILATLALALGSAAGLMAQPVYGGAVYYGPGPGVYIATPPPLPPPMPAYVHRPVRPGPNFVWVNGFWNWSGRRYAWNAGYWAPRPYANAYWVAPRYVGGRYYRGYWGGPRRR
jgi:hypothetical protein